MTTWTAKESGRLDKLVAEHITDFSRSQLQKLIEQGFVRVENEVVTLTKHSVKSGANLSFTPPNPDPLFPKSEEIPLEILYEDDAILVINKPVDMVVHPNNFHESGTLVQAILAIRPEISRALYDKDSEVSRLRPGIVHRLDKDTSGVMVIAKTSDALQHLAQQFHAHSTQKEYRAVLYGSLTANQTVTAPIQRKGSSDKNRMGASHDPEEGRTAISHFSPLSVMAPYAAWPQETVTLAKITIETGRTHQIRVHSKFIGHPVLGDALYGNKPSIHLSKKLGISHQLLHAYSLTITHPTSGKSCTFQAPLPESFQVITNLSHDVQTHPVQLG